MRLIEIIALAKYQEILDNIFMISMKSLKKSCRVSSPEAVAALFISALIGLSMVALVPERNISEPGYKAVDSVTGRDAFTEVAEDSEAVVSSGDLALGSADLEKVISFCITHTTASRGFVVFRNGTCVLVNEPSENPVKEALSILAGCAQSEARFLSERTAEGDLVVTFKGSVFHWIPGSDINTLEEWSLANFETLLSENERKEAAPGWVPPANARLGLVSRKRLLEDAASNEVVKVLRPNTSVASISE